MIPVELVAPQKVIRSARPARRAAVRQQALLSRALTPGGAACTECGGARAGKASPVPAAHGRGLLLAIALVYTNTVYCIVLSFLPPYGYVLKKFKKWSVLRKLVGASHIFSDVVKNLSLQYRVQ